MGFVLILVYLALNLLSPAEMFPALAPYRIMIILTVVTALFSVVPLLQSSVLVSVRTQIFLMILLIAAIVLSWVPHRWFGGTLFALDSILPSMVVYFLLVVNLKSVRGLQILRFVLVAIALFILFKGLSEIPEVEATGMQTPYVLGGLISTGSLMIRIRGLGMLHDPNEYGQFLLLLLPLMYADSDREGKRPARHFFAIPLTLLFLVGVYYTNSRGTQLGLVLLLGFILVKRYKAIGGIISVVSGGTLVALINTFRDRKIGISTGVDRLAIWSNGLSYFKSSPLWGIGYYGFVNRNRQTAHNSFLLAACELGIMGYVVWMALFVVTIQLLRQVAAAKTTPLPLARWAEAVKLSMYVFLCTSFFISRTYTIPLFMLWGMSGAIIAMAGGESQFNLNRSWPVLSLGLCVASIMLIYILVRLRAV